MMTAIYVTAAALIVAAACFGIRYFVRASQRFGGERVIICPEMRKQAMIEVDAKHAALSPLVVCQFAGTATLRKRFAASTTIW